MIFFTPLILRGQDKHDHFLISKNKIKAIETYSVSLQDSSKSILNTKEIFNNKGRRTSVKIFNKNGSTSEYKYYYIADTIKDKRVTIFNDTIHSTTKLNFDEKGRLAKTTDYDSNNKENGTYEIINYKRNERTVERKFYFNNELHIHTKENYSKSGELLKQYKRIDKRWVKSEKPNTKEDTIENYNGTGLTLKRIVHSIKSDCTILGILEPIKLIKNDQLTTERYINEKGLIEFEIQRLNSKLIAKKKYKYAS
jgi:hypothetical protein